MTDPAQREMVFASAAEIARRAVEKVTNAGLADGRLVEEVVMGDRKWRITINYCVEHENVKVSGYLVPEEDEVDLSVPSFFRRFYGAGEEVDGFEFFLPASWLPRLPTSTHHPREEGHG